MDWNQIIKYFLSTSVITAGLVYIIKILLDKFAESRVEKYKHELNLETEKFRNDLNTSAIEHQIVYSKLYEERGQVIKKIYILLVELEQSLANLTTVWQGPEWVTDTDRDKITNESILNLRRELEYNRLFFSDDLCKKIETILSDSHNIRVKMIVAKKKEERIDKYSRRTLNLKPEELTEPLDIWTELDSKVQNEIKSARLELAQEFRLLIGVK